MKIAVTAATGSLGKLVIESLLKRVPASDIVAVVRNADKAAPLAEKGIELRVASYDDKEALTEAFADIDHVLLISGTEIGKRVQQHINVIDAAVANNVSLVAYTSAPRVDVETIVSPEHKATEEYLAANNVPTVLLRNGWYTENFVDRVDEATRSGSISAAVGEGRVASASRIDYAEAAAIAVSSDNQAGKIYQLSGDVAWDFNDLAAAISTIIESPVTYVPVTAEEIAKNLSAAGLPPEMIGFVQMLDSDTAKGYLGVQSNELSTLIGRPTTPLVDGLAAAHKEKVASGDKGWSM